MAVQRVPTFGLEIAALRRAPDQEGVQMPADDADVDRVDARRIAAARGREQRSTFTASMDEASARLGKSGFGCFEFGPSHHRLLAYGRTFRNGRTGCARCQGKGHRGRRLVPSFPLGSENGRSTGPFWDTMQSFMAPKGRRVHPFQRFAR
jgi:hypothetical protein